MIYRDLRDFIAQLEQRRELKQIDLPISPHLEMTEIGDRVLRAAGPALLFNRPRLGDGQISKIPVLTNLFGKVERIAWAMGQNDIYKLREIGKTLALLKEPEPPQGFRDLYDKFPLLKQILNMLPKQVNNACCQEIVYHGEQVDLYSLPLQHCWPGDVAPLLTWGLTITRGPEKKRQNLGIYRQQLLNKNQLIMRWLAHRGGALDYRAHCQLHPNEPFPLTVAIGCDPATLLAAVTPIPDTLSEYQFAGLLRGSKTELVKCLSNDLQVPATTEIVLEGEIRPNDIALEGPYGDHTGYYNEQGKFPIFTVLKMTTRYQPIYHSTYTGKPPDEPAILGLALNEIFIPLLQKQFPEIVDFYLPPEGCSYRLAVVSIKKQYPGHARRIMMGIWGFLRQFMYTKFIIVTDEDINIRSWQEVIWAITTRVDAARDISIIENTPIDYLDFASPSAGLGSKMGLDATNKFPGETNREWGTTIEMNSAVKSYIDSIWQQLKLD